MLNIELICHHPPHKCRCRHNVQTDIDRTDLTSELIKYNPGLLKYLGKKHIQTAETTAIGVELQRVGSQENVKDERDKPYRSIVQEKGLNYTLSNNYIQDPYEKPKQQGQSQPVHVAEPETGPQIQVIDPYTHGPAEGSKPVKKQPVLNPKQRQIRKYHKDLKNQSRYLSDTAFRKYFNRQCFQNYGRTNTHGKADGFVYGNYMKTFNINPHTGQNMPSNEQTFYHALVSGSPEKYANYEQEVKMGMTQRVGQDLSRSLGKDKLNVQKMLADNQKHSKMQEKYDHLHIKVSKSPKHFQSQKQLRNPSQLGIVTKKQFNNQEPIKLSYAAQSAKYKPSMDGDALQPNAHSFIIAEKSPQKDNRPSTLSVQEQGQPRPTINEQYSQIKNISSPKALNCEHKEPQSIQCACCVNKMKKMILDLTQQDPDLAERIVNSAKKNVLYKNYALNNYENATLNPHNYRSQDGQLNVYQQ